MVQDEAKAFEWYKRAAELGDADAMFNLGLCFEDGRGVAKDEAKAFKLYKRAAELGNDHANERLQWG